MYPIKVDGIWVDHMGRQWRAAKPYPGRSPRARQALAKVVTKLDPEEAARRTQKSQTYWAAYRAGQAAKREAGIKHQPPRWLGARKRPKPKRQWLPGEHKKPKPSTTVKEQNVPPPAVNEKIKFPKSGFLLEKSGMGAGEFTTPRPERR